MHHDPGCIFLIILIIVASIFSRGYGGGNGLFYWLFGNSGCGSGVHFRDSSDTYWDYNMMYRKPRKKPEHAPIPEGEYLKPESDFSDDRLDDFIREGRFNEARKYLYDVIKVANEMGDKQTATNYYSYEAKIAAASADVTLGWWHKKDQEARDVIHLSKESDAPKIKQIPSPHPFPPPSQPPPPLPTPPQLHLKPRAPEEQKDKDVHMEFLD